MLNVKLDLMMTPDCFMPKSVQFNKTCVMGMIINLHNINDNDRLQFVIIPEMDLKDDPPRVRCT